MPLTEEDVVTGGSLPVSAAVAAAVAAGSGQERSSAGARPKAKAAKPLFAPSAQLLEQQPKAANGGPAVGAALSAATGSAVAGAIGKATLQPVFASSALRIMESMLATPNGFLGDVTNTVDVAFRPVVDDGSGDDVGPVRGYGGVAYQVGSHIQAPPPASGLSGLLSNLPTIGFERSKETKKFVVKVPGGTVQVKASASTAITQARGSDRVKVTIDPKRGGSVDVVGTRHVSVGLDALLRNSALHLKTLAQKPSVHRAGRVTIEAKQTIKLGGATVSINGKKVVVPVTASVEVSTTLPNKAKVELSVDVQVPTKVGLTTVTTKVELDATGSPSLKKFGRPGDRVGVPVGELIEIGIGIVILGAIAAGAGGHLLSPPLAGT